MTIVDRRWSYIGIIVMLVGLVVLVVAAFPQELGIPFDVPVGAFGSTVIVLGVTVYLLQRRAEQDASRSDPPPRS
jgi:fatty acid desaturase